MTSEVCRNTFRAKSRFPIGGNNKLKNNYMPKKETAVANQEEVVTTKVVTLSEADQQALAELREGSGEGDGMSYTFIPEIKIDNNKTEMDINGRNVPVLNAPMWLEKVETGERDQDGQVIYKWEPLLPEINAIVLKVQYQVKEKWDQKAKDATGIGYKFPFFYSRPFDSTQSKLPINIYSQQEIIASLSYDDLKYSQDERFKGNYDLVMIIWLWCEDNTLRVIKNKGSIRGAMFEYFNKFRKPDTMSAHWTKFKAVMTTNAAGLTYNGVELSVNNDIPVELSFNLAKQKELNATLDAIKAQIGQRDEEIAQKKADEQINSMLVEAPADTKKVEDIAVSDVPFN